MRFLLVVLFILFLSGVDSLCVSLGGVCYGTKQNSMQFNINIWGIPTYEDVVDSEFNENQCGRRRLSYLHHNVLKCSKTKTKGLFNCQSTTRSVWIKVFDTSDAFVQQLLSQCNSNMANKYIDISKMSCRIDGEDPFAEQRQYISKVENRNITVTDDHFPEYEGYYPERDSCVWNYEVNGIWSTLVITIVTCCVIVLILFIAIFIYAQKHRSEKRAKLNRNLDKGLMEEHDWFVS